MTYIERASPAPGYAEVSDAAMQLVRLNMDWIGLLSCDLPALLPSLTMMYMYLMDVHCGCVDCISIRTVAYRTVVV